MTSETVTTTLDAALVKADFPLLMAEREIPLVYLDSAATSQKPRVVLDAMTNYYETINANVARGVYQIAEQATNALEDARRTIGRFIGAPSADEIIFTKNATESLNLIAQSWGRANLSAGDAIVLTEMEHHANIVPWQMIAAERGLEVRWIPLGEDGQLDLTDLDRLLDGARVVALTAMSNVLGTLNPVRRIADAAHAAGAIVAVDACQLVPHVPCDVIELGADFFAFSGHKMCGPTGIGILWGRQELLAAMPPFLGGGGMIEQVTLEGFSCAPVPHKFEAGTPPIAEAIGLAAAVDYLNGLGMERVREHEVALTAYTLQAIRERFGESAVVHGPSEPSARGGVFSIALDGVHPHDVSQILDTHGVCVRAGHHCAKPLMKVLGVGATARASVYIYNDESDVDALVDALAEAQSFFGF